jgi:cation diffusion facilitator CzcD-associated flavoprotein CzcO
MTTIDEATAGREGTETLPQQVDVAVIGSGFSGLGMAIRLKQEGMDDFVVLERGDEVGGTWHFNTYPGCGCDVPSHLYSYSFAPNPDWSETYSRQPEIGAYLRRCADEFGVRPHIRLSCEVTSASWDEAAGRWDIETTHGDLRARVLVAGPGPLFEPKAPPLVGLDTFEGHVFHSARWDHDHTLAGKRVAAVGTGASAIQFVPSIQPEVEQLHVFQRTAPWIMPHTNRNTTAFERRLYRAVPALQRLVRGGIYVGRESLVLGFVKNPKLMGVVERIARRHIHQNIPHPELRDKVTPNYTIGCKRILPSNRWYPALAQPNVELHTDGIAEVRPHSIVTEDGSEHEVDTIIFGTGFKVTEMPVSSLLRGRDGRTLSETWAGSPHAYRGATIPGFPNLFMLLGPNTGLGHSSMIYMIESQIAYVIGALRTMAERGAVAVDVRGDVERDYNSRVDTQLEGTVWNTGCASWYLDATGRNGVLWPDWTWRFRRRTARFDAESYQLRSRSQDPAAVAA